MSQPEPRDTLLEINDILTDWRNYTINDEDALKKVCEAIPVFQQQPGRPTLELAMQLLIEAIDLISAKSIPAKKAVETLLKNYPAEAGKIALHTVESFNLVNVDAEEAFHIIRSHAEAIAVRNIQNAHAREQENNAMASLTNMRNDAETTQKRVKDLYTAAATFHYWSDSNSLHPNPPPAP